MEKVKKATGYEIQYTTKGFGNKKDTKTIKVSKAKITSAQLKKLKRKQDIKSASAPYIQKPDIRQLHQNGLQ